MKHLFIFFAFFFSVSTLFAQRTGDITIYSNTGKKFYVVLNGIRQNTNAETNVKITGLTETYYSCRVMAEDKSFNMEKNIGVKKDSVISYRIIEKKGKFKLRYYSEASLGTAPTVPDQATVVYHSSETPQETVNVNTSGVNGNSSSSSMNTSSSSTTTTTTSSSQNGQGGNVSMDINMNGTGMNTNVTTNGTGSGNGTGGGNQNGTGAGNGQNNGENINVSINLTGAGLNTSTRGTGTGNGTGGGNQNGTGAGNGKVHSSSTYEETTTNSTTTTINGETTHSEQTTVTTSSTVNGSTTFNQTTTSSGGSSGNTGNLYTDDDMTMTLSGGCTTTDADMEQITAQISNETFPEDKMTVAQTVVKNKCLTVAQIKTITNLFDFDDDKMTFVKAAHLNCLNQSDYHQLMDVFTFSDDKKELENFIHSK